MPDGNFNFHTPPTTGPDMQQTPMNFQSPPSHQQQQQMHQDSGVSFSTPSQVSQDQANMFNSPKDGGMVYQDSKMYSSPGQMHHLPNDHNVYQQSPLGHATPGEEMDMQNLGMFGTIDPNNLGRHQQH